jgi:hypothetical protein
MTDQCGIWIEGKKAILVNLAEGKTNVTEIAAEIEDRVHHFHEGDKGSFMGTRHINNQKKFDERRKHQVKNFLGKVLQHARASDDIFLIGPAGMKTRLRTLIRKDPQLAGKLRAVETAGHLTMPQLKARVIEFFGNAG